MLRLKIILQSNYLYIFFLLISFIFAFVKIYVIQYHSLYNINVKEIKGYLTNYTYKNNNYKITINAKETIICNYYSKKKINFELGSKIKVLGELSKPSNNTIPNTFNYKKYLNNHHIFFIIKAKKVIITQKNNNYIFKIKNYLYQKMNKYKYTKEYLKAFILGDKSELNEYQIYQENGVSHLFAISGMHIGLLSAILLFIFKKNKFQNIIVITFLVTYGLITNYSASMIRSIIFFILIKINNKYDLNISIKNLLLLTGSILIINDPLILYDVGFEYSFLVTYGLIISTKYYKKKYFYNLMITTIIALLFSLPITLYYNYDFNLLSFINNIIIVPLISFIIYPLSLLTIIVNFLEPVLYLFIQILEIISNFLNLLSVNIIIPKINIIIYLIYYVLLLLFIKTNNYKFILINIIILLLCKSKPLLDNNTYIYFLNVGQGDSTFIYNKHESILIDTGGLPNYNISDNTLKFIKSLGINHIDLLLLTHGDSDHMKDSINIVKNFKVKNVMINNNSHNALEKELIKLKPHIIKKYNSKFNFKVYNNYIGNDENNSSIISLLKINNINILFMGDAPQSEELLFLRDYKIIVDIIKLGHHGSKTSSNYNFLKSIRVKEAIISSGKNNLYHFPSKETIWKLKELKIKYNDTKEKGTIMYKIGLNNYTLNYFLP